MTTFVKDGYIYVTCPYCSAKPAEENANPAKRPHPFEFMQHCAGCGAPLEIDWSVIETIHASYQGKR